MGADGETADDVAQDAFLAGFEQISEFRGEGAFRTWISRIAARSYARRWRREARAELLADGPDVDDPPTGVGADTRIDLDDALKALSDPELNTAWRSVPGWWMSSVRRPIDRFRTRFGPMICGPRCTRGASTR